MKGQKRAEGAVDVKNTVRPSPKAGGGAAGRAVLSVRQPTKVCLACCPLFPNKHKEYKLATRLGSQMRVRGRGRNE